VEASGERERRLVTLGPTTTAEKPLVSSQRPAAGGRSALKILIDRLGQDHREVAIMRMTLPFTLQRLGRMDDAIALSRLANATLERNENDAVAILRRTGGPSP